MKRKILFIASHRKDRAPGQRFRFEQYFDYLEKNGFQCKISYIVNEKDDKILYRQGKYVNKFFITLKSWLHRMNDVVNAKNYDIIFIFREAFLTGSTFFENRFRK